MLRTNAFRASLDRLMPDWPLGWRLGLLRAVCGHHGRPPNDTLMMPLARDVCDVCLEAALTFADLAADAIGALPAPRPAKAEAQRLIWQVAGLAVLADWIGSNEAWFGAQSTAMSLNQYWLEHALPQAQREVARAGVLPAQVRSFLRLTDLAPHAGTPTPLQAQAQTMVLTATGPVLIVIEDQTGAGKTEAALLLAHGKRALHEEFRNRSFRQGEMTALLLKTRRMRLLARNVRHGWRPTVGEHSWLMSALARSTRHCSRFCRRAMRRCANGGWRNGC